MLALLSVTEPFEHCRWASSSHIVFERRATQIGSLFASLILQNPVNDGRVFVREIEQIVCRSWVFYIKELRGEEFVCRLVGVDGLSGATLGSCVIMLIHREDFGFVGNVHTMKRTHAPEMRLRLWLPGACDGFEVGTGLTGAMGRVHLRLRCRI